METEIMYEELKEDLIRFARSISRHEQEAFDLMQDAWEKSLKEDRLLMLPLHKQRAWFYRVMKNRLIDDRRKEKRLLAWTEEAEFSSSPAMLNGLDMADLLGRLPPKMSDLIFKRYYLGMNSREIGRQLNLPDATVRYNLHIAIKKLRKLMEDE